MSNQYNFRIWDKSFKEFIYPNNPLFPGYLLICLTAKNDDRFIAQLSTNRSDCNGKKIYEGDKLKFLSSEEYTKKEYWYPLFELNRDDLDWAFKHIGGGINPGSPFFDLRHYPEDKLEVIGHIFE